MPCSDWSSDVCSSDLVILGDGVQHVADEQVLVGMAHRQQRRAIVAVHGRDRRGDRRVKQGGGGVYRHITNARASNVISHTKADYGPCKNGTATWKESRCKYGKISVGAIT